MPEIVGAVFVGVLAQPFRNHHLQDQRAASEADENARLAPSRRTVSVFFKWQPRCHGPAGR